MDEYLKIFLIIKPQDIVTKKGYQFVKETTLHRVLHSVTAKDNSKIERVKNTLRKEACDLLGTDNLNGVMIQFKEQWIPKKSEPITAKI